MLGCDAGTYEGQQVGIDQVCMRGRHPVRQAGVGFKRPVLQKLDGPCSGRGERANLVVLAMHHQDRNVDHLEIVVKLDLGKGFDAVIRQFAQGGTVEIKRAGSRPSAKGLRIISPVMSVLTRSWKRPNRHAFVGLASPSNLARTAWHTHPLGQTLIVTSGLGRVQREGGPIEEIRPGDVIWFPPGEKHWHGATPTTAMAHSAIQEALNGKQVDWLEQVSDEQYRK